MQQYSLNINVEPAPQPFITFNNNVACQYVLMDYGNAPAILDDAGGCIKVCAYSAITYTGNSIPGITGSSYHWTISGGHFNNANGPLTASGNSVTAYWGAPGQGYIKIIESTTADCQEEKIVCIEITETPTALFTTGLPFTDNPDGCENGWEVCLNQTVFFTDLSTAATASPIIYWEWDFGDGSPHSALQNPSHTYTATGVYPVTLTVTNRCNCKATYEACIVVKDEPGPPIFCPSVVCENSVAYYSTNATCSPDYLWSVTGGNIVDPMLNPASPPYPNMISVHWNNVGPSGFGTVTLDGSNCDGLCTSTNSISVPVILAQGTIDGPAKVCTDKYYKYRLPAWPATNFTWTLTNNSNGAAISSYADNSHEIEILSGSAAGTFEINCTYYNTLVKCGGSATFTVNVIPSAVINAPQKSCAGSPVSCTLNPPATVTGTTTWTVTEPVNGTQTQITTSNATTVTLPGNLFTDAGDYLIEASNPSSFCDPQGVIVKVVAHPTPPLTVSGPNPVCLFYPYTYTATGAAQNTQFYWEALENGNVLATGSGPVFNVQWTQQGLKELNVYSERLDLPGCRSDAQTLIIDDESITGNINGPNQVCSDATDAYSFSYLGAEDYFWKLSNANLGSISSGQGTSGVSVLWNHTNTNIVVDLICIVTQCGQVFSFSYPIGITAQPVFTLTPTPGTTCENTPVSFAVSSTPSTNISGIAWNFGDGATANTAGTTTSHPYTFTGTNQQNFTVTATITHTGCAVSQNTFTNTVTNSVTILPAPDVNLTPGGTVVCTQGGSAQQMGPFVLSLSSTGGSIVWYKRIGSTTTVQQTGGTTCNVMNATSQPFNTTYYYAEVTGSNGCVAKSNEFVINYVACTPPATCIPVAPAGWSGGTTNFIANYLSCDNGIATAQIHQQPVILGTMGSNLMKTEWFMYNVPGLVGPLNPATSTTNKQAASPVYSFNKPGDYSFSYKAFYRRLGGAPSDRCLESKMGTLTIPLIADFNLILACNGANNGYTLTLADFTAAHPAHIVTTRQWYVDGVLSPSSSSVYTVPGNMPQGLHTIKLIVQDVHGHSCERTQTITVPQLPVAAYTVTSTDPLSTPAGLSTCEDKEVEFTSTGTGAISKHEWFFGDGTSSWVAPVTTRVYGYIPPLNPYNVTTNLTVTDAYGCTSTATKPIDIFDNNIFLNPNATYTPQDQILCAGTVASIQLTGLSLGNPPFSYTWYQATQPLTAPSSPAYQTGAAGAYWVEVTDAHGCQANANPTPATVKIIQPPPVIILGDLHLCAGDDIKLSVALYAQPPASLSYSWVRNPGNVPAGNTKDITESGLLPGVYTYTLTQGYDPGTGTICYAASAPYPVEIHATPAPPVPSLQMLDCDLYEVELSATHPLAPPYTFTWSTGQSGTPVSVFHGGPYRVWVTDLYGCKNYEDIDVPIAPNTYFWRFPQNACYAFCLQELPRQIDGPSYEVFDTWEWWYNGGLIPVNGPYSPGGSNSVCDPLWLEDTPNGMGAGLYQWSLGNGYCVQTSDPMDLTLTDCCHIDVEALLECIDPVNQIYSVNIFAAGYPMQGIYNLSVTDANGQPIGYFLPPNNTGVAPAGSMSVTVDMHLFQISSPITICVSVTDVETGFKCVGCQTVVPPLCDHAHRPADGALAPAEQSSHLMALIPNPATATVKISYDFSALNVPEGATRYITITDAVGRTVGNLRTRDDKGMLIQDVSGFAQGIYMVQSVWNGKVIETQKLVVAH